MYHGLARGHATAFIAHQTSFDAVEDWIRGGACKVAMDTFAESGKSKKPGRCAKRLAPLLRPVFRLPMVAEWTKARKLLFARGLASSQESQIFDLGREDVPLFSERAVFLNHLFFTDTPEETNVQMSTPANMSHHAITRLLERDFASPEDLPRMVEKILFVACGLGASMDRARLEDGRQWAFLVPFEGGALPVVSMSIRPDRKHDHAANRTMSVRTFLAPDMIGSRDRERMSDFDVVSATSRRGPGKWDDLPHWMAANARPWSADGGRS